MKNVLLSSAAVLWLFNPAAAVAQRADDNAIADAEDAFGSTDGGEDLGLYDPFNVRGFSPIDAGNVRIEGVYFDRQADLSPRLQEGNRIRVGLSAATYAFPAPSGVVDYRLRTPGQQPMVSVVTQANSFGGALLEVDAALPLSSTLSIGGGIGFSRSEYPSGNNAGVFNLAALAHWRPSKTTGAKLFWSRTRMADEDIFPIILGDGRTTPPQLKRRRFLGQRWADLETERFNYGAIGETRLGDFALRGGIFRSVNDVREGHNVFLEAGPPGELAPRLVTAYPGRSAASTSGELGLARTFSTGAVQHRMQLVARGRAQDRAYGGTARVSLPPAPFGRSAFVPKPPFVFGSKNDDRVRQWSIGIDYQLRIPGIGQIGAALQKVDYSKVVTTPSGDKLRSDDGPWLFNAAATIEIAPGLSAYGSYTRGLEESDVAPETALNRDEAPPAIRTEQIDAGAKLRLSGMTLIAGMFQITRPYYGIDGSNTFRRLGDVRHRGLEVSLSGSPLEDLTLVAGGTLLEARVSGEEVNARTLGLKPVDVPSRRAVASVDWRPEASATSFDLAVEHIGPNVGDARNLVRVAPYTTVNLGLRHRFSLFGTSAVVRVQATNLLNEYGWEVFGNNAFVYIQSRQVLTRLLVDF
jgi:iron complex outermembrane receptor protein